MQSMVWGGAIVETLLFSWGRINISAVRMAAAANAASMSSRFLSAGGFALRCLPTALATSPVKVGDQSPGAYGPLAA